MNTHFEFKVVVAGPFAAGKTTMIRTISDDEIVGTEAPTTGAESAVKATTTVGMEYGTMYAEGHGFTAELNIYGVPGQDRFEFMWDIVGTGMDGLFLLVDASRPDTWSESLLVGQHFQMARTAPIVVGVNRAHGDADLHRQACEAVPLDGAAYVAFEVTEPGQVRTALAELLTLVLDQLPGSTFGEIDRPDNGGATTPDRGNDPSTPHAPTGVGG